MSVCQKYFASKKAKEDYETKNHERRDRGFTCSRVRSLHVMYIQDEQAFCILEDESGNKEAEWVDCMDVENIDISENEIEVDSLPLISNLNEWVVSPWTEVVPGQQ